MMLWFPFNKAQVAFLLFVGFCLCVGVWECGKGCVGVVRDHVKVEWK